MNTSDPILSDREQSEELLDIKAFLFLVLRRWYWILFCVIAAYALGRLYLRYTIPVYQASSKVLIKQDPGKGGSLSEEAVLQEIGIFKPNNNLNNEIQILKSRTLMEKVMRELGLDVKYVGIGKIKDTELYKNAPIRLDSVYWGSKRRSARINLVITSDTECRILTSTDEGEILHRFGTPLVIRSDTFWLSYPGTREQIGEQFQISVGASAGRYLSELSITTVADFSSVLLLRMKDPIAQKASDILNKLIEVYNQEAIEDKNQVAEKTLEFINDRLLLLTNELNTVESGLESYKELNNIPAEMVIAVNFILTEISNYDSELTKQKIKLELLNTVKETLLEENGEDSELIAANVILEDQGGLSEQINGYNSLMLQKSRLERSAGTENPELLSVNNELREVRSNIIESVQTLSENLELSVRQTEQKLQELQTRINQIPRQERELLEIKRQQNIKEALYLFLLQKREETALSAAITVPNARVVDAAITIANPISPKPLQIYAIFLVLGFILPIGAMFLRELLDDKIYNESDINQLISTPVLGNVVQNKSADTLVIRPNSRTPISEMFRLIRTNLTYFTGDSEKNKCILVTSAVSGDGKTFIAVNLSLSLSLTNKKVVVLGMDLRKPKLAKYLTNTVDQERIGITNYLIGNAEVEDIIYTTEIDANLHYIPSGPAPPNPAELLSGPRMEKLFSFLKDNFDFIVIDTAPIGLVADAFLLAGYADLSLFTVRYGKTTKSMLKEIDQMKSMAKFKNTAIILNGVKKGSGYGYGYSAGYGYYEEEPNDGWWSSLREKLFNKQ